MRPTDDEREAGQLRMMRRMIEGWRKLSDADRRWIVESSRWSLVEWDRRAREEWEPHPPARGA